LNGEPVSFVTLNVDVEVADLDEAVMQAAEGLTLMGESLQNIADNPNSTPEHQQQVKQTLSQVEQLSDSLDRVVEELPATIEKGLLPVVRISNELSSKAQRILVITGIVFIVIVLAALAGVYYFVLAPGTRSVVKTGNLLNELADTLKTTAEIVEVSSERNLKVMQEVQSVRNQTEQV